MRAVNHERTVMYWHIGQRIFEEEQRGKERADYGAYLVQMIAERLQPEFGSGFSKRQISYCRQLYRTFPIVHALRAQLSWTQYKMLLSIDNEDKREFYIAESVKNNWTSRQLERQINSQLYERLLLSNDKESVLAVARNERQPMNPKEIIKDPMVLEFLGLQREAAYYENGFTFVSRQKRLHLDGDDFFADLVFYNRLLQCFVIIEIKTHKLTHQDIGQLQMYVNYYDRVEKQPHENPTIGILLCADKNDAVVKFSLPENQQQIIASQYRLYLPSEETLLAEMHKEIAEFEQRENSPENSQIPNPSQTQEQQ